MHSLKNIEKANESNWLWPPVADAIDTFLRRREDADGYERIWRLIHVWESIVTTLCSVAVARLREAEQAEALYRRSREFLYGKQWNEIDRSFSTGQGALDGGIDGRIEVLRLIARGDSLDSAFLSKLLEFKAQR